jgi:hypothetical protein
MIVKATREGLLGHKTASGYVIDSAVPFVALPSTKALGRFVRLRNPLNGKTAIAIVLDVGPWEEQDHEYVLDGARPRVESSPTDSRGRPHNGAAIDLGEKIWRALEMHGNTEIEWEFLA